jgi:hypothetical protein
MYYALKDGSMLPAGVRPVWVKRQDNGVMVLCGEDEAQGVVIDGETYHLRGRKELDAPTVDLIWKEETETILEQLTNCQLALAEIYETMTGGE